jgi:transcriptional regulator GlxA family with amidase domain
MRARREPYLGAPGDFLGKIGSYRVSKENRVREIAILAPPGAQSLDISGPLDVFREAAKLDGAGPTYKVRLVSTQADRVIRAGGMQLLADQSIWDGDDGPIDTLIVAGTPDFEFAMRDPAVRDWLQRRAVNVRRCGSVCTGAFLLASAGLLDGRRVTTDWRHTAKLAATCPTAVVEPDHVYVRDGALHTSAGAAAGIDLALALVEEDYDQTIAAAVASRLAVPGNRAAEQRQSDAPPALQFASHPKIRELQAWVLEHLAEDLSVDRLASRSGYGARNFSRVFHRETGTTAAQFVAAARVERAVRLLEDSSMPLKRVAAHCGYSSAAHLRRAVIAKAGCGPHEYRNEHRRRLAVDPELRIAA